MTRRPAPARPSDFVIEQAARNQRARASSVARTLKARTRAARTSGLESVTVRLPIGDARLIADALTEWVSEREEQATRARVTRVRANLETAALENMTKPGAVTP